MANRKTNINKLMTGQALRRVAGEKPQGHLRLGVGS
jgi:hypothetical protein